MYRNLSLPRLLPCTLRFWLFLVLPGAAICSSGYAQTSATGALTGVALDTSGAAVPGVSVQVIEGSERIALSTSTDDDGRFAIPLLPPGTYQLQARKAEFKTVVLPDLHIHVTETLRVELHLRLAERLESASVFANARMLQTDSASLGRVVNETAVDGLPLATRNFAQVAGLSPGVSVGVFNAGELGLGAVAVSQIAASNDGIYAHGARSYDNNFQLDGISVNDVQGSGAGSGGIPIPNPDSIQEFKVQTGLYDAAYGRYAGANVSVITKTGSNEYHGSVFEFLRNEVLNANDFFSNETRQPRAALQQNQFGFGLGGALKRDKLFFFASYQGTRQVNGLAAGQSRTACTASLNEPPLTNDRSPAALGKLFGGMSGALGGVAVNSDGSNINPVTLALLKFKLPDGNYLIPTPQTIDPSKPLASQGFSVFSEPCHFNENQSLANVDYVFSQRSRIAVRLLLADDETAVTFPGNGFNPAGNIPGFASFDYSGYRVFSLSHTYTFGSNWLNEARIGYVRTRGETDADSPFSWSDVGAAEGQMNENNELPSLKILGSVSVASGFPRIFAQNSLVFSDNLSFVCKAHTVRMGGSVTRLQDNVDLVGLGSFVEFLSWPDFLLGLRATSNGSEFSNVFASFDDFGLTSRQYRVWEGAGFVQDDYRMSQSFTLNLGLRYEHLGQFADNLGRNASFDVAKADLNPPPTGSVAGYVVASNFPGVLPPGVTRLGNKFGTYTDGQDTLAPRAGFAWQIWPASSRLVLRGGYGTYYSRSTGQAFYQSVFGAPFSEFRLIAGAANANATFQAPFQQPFPTPDSFPSFPAYGPLANTTIYGIAPGFRPSLIQQFGLNLQAEIHSGLLLEVGYFGAHGTHLIRQRSLNQALPATTNDPIRTATTDTVANIPLRVPILGIPPDSLQLMESEGGSWHNGLEVSLTKRLNRGLQLLTSYTFSKTQDTDGADINSTSTGNALTLGDQNSPSQRWGRASIDRPQRFVFSTTWALPNPSRGLRRVVLGDWDLAAILVVQAGTALTVAYTNADNVFGISEDRAQLSGTCQKSQLISPGPMGAKLNNYFNKACFTTPPVIGADGIGTAFGDSGTGIVEGPGQANLDLAVTKVVAIPWPRESSTLDLRVEFFNALNHPQFANPDTNFSSSTFGVISSTSVNPRVGQLAIRISF